MQDKDKMSAVGAEGVYEGAGLAEGCGRFEFEVLLEGAVHDDGGDEPERGGCLCL